MTLVEALHVVYARDVYSRCRVMKNVNIPSESILHLLLFPRKLCFFFYIPALFLSLAECSGQNGGSSRDRSHSEEDFPAHPAPKKKKNQTRNALVVGCILINIAAGCRCRVQWEEPKRWQERRRRRNLFYFVFILLLLFTPWFSIFLNLSLAAWAAVIDAEQRKSPGKMRSCWRRNISASFFFIIQPKKKKKVLMATAKLLTWHWWCGKPGKESRNFLSSPPGLFFVIFFSFTFLLPPPPPCNCWFTFYFLRFVKTSARTTGTV